MLLANSNEIMDIELFEWGDFKNFKLEQADFRRQWMDETPNQYAYHCLPLKIANQIGWVLKNPTSFNATYVNDDFESSVKIEFDNLNDQEKYGFDISSHFGNGIITFTLPFIFKTPEPWCIWARGLPNYYKDNVCFLEGIIETFWTHMSSTYNIKLIEKDKKIRFEKDEPLAFFTITNLKEIDESTIIFKNPQENKKFSDDFKVWKDKRSEANNNYTRKEIWQKHYKKGVHDQTLEKNKDHKSKINLSVRQYKDERKLY